MELVYRMELGQGWARLDHVGPLGQGRQLGLYTVDFSGRVVSRGVTM